MPRSILVASLAALLSLFVWASAQAKEIYLPTLSTGTTPNLDWQNDYNLGNPSVEIRLKDGSYSFDNGRLEIYFQMHSNGHWADSARFFVASRDPHKFYCSDGYGYFSDGVSVGKNAFSFINLRDVARLNANTPTMGCEVISETQAECKVYDPRADRDPMYPCGGGKATVTRIGD